MYGRKEKEGTEIKLGYICLFGASGICQNKIDGLAQRYTIFVLEHLFAGLKKLVPNGEKLEVHILGPIVIYTPGLEAPHFYEYFHENQMKNEYSRSFQVPLCSEGPYVYVYDREVRNIQNIHIPFGFVLLTISDIVRGGHGGSKCSLTLHGSSHT